MPQLPQVPPTVPTNELRANAGEAAVSVSDESSSKGVVSPFLVWTQRYRTVVTTLVAFAASTTITGRLPLSAGLRMLRRNMMAGCIIFTVGDLGAQLWTRPRDRAFALDQKRFSIAMIIGALWAGLVNPAVYMWAEHLFPGSGSWKRVVIKMILSCSILSTAGNWASMFLRRWLGGQGFQSCVQSCNADFEEVLWDDLKIWPVYDLVCYSCIPPVVRPISNAIVSR